MQLDNDLKKLSEDWAEKVFHEIEAALTDPTQGMSDETSAVYTELRAWNWLDDLPIDLGDNADTTEEENARNLSIKTHEFYQRILAMIKYRQLKWQKDHPPKPKRSKWEIVTGCSLKKKP